MSDLTTKLIDVQTRLHAPKTQRNNFAGYSYRNCEDILEAVKPLLAENGLVLTISDELVHFPSTDAIQVVMLTDSKGKQNSEVIGSDRFYIKATATVHDGDASLSTSAYAREPENKKGSDDSQITGSASSYARKYALNGLFLIDDTKDADTNEQHQQRQAAPRQQRQASPRQDDVNGTPDKWGPGTGGDGIDSAPENGRTAPPRPDALEQVSADHSNTSAWKKANATLHATATSIIDPATTRAHKALTLMAEAKGVPSVKNLDAKALLGMNDFIKGDKFKAWYAANIAPKMPPPDDPDELEQAMNDSLGI